MCSGVKLGVKFVVMAVSISGIGFAADGFQQGGIDKVSHVSSWMSQRHPKPSVPYMEFLSSLYPRLPPGSRLWVTETSTHLEKPELEILHHSHAGPSPHSNLTFELSLGSVTSLHVHCQLPRPTASEACLWTGLPLCTFAHPFPPPRCPTGVCSRQRSLSSHCS